MVADVVPASVLSAVFFFVFDGQCDTGVMVAEAAFSEGVIVYHTWYQVRFSGLDH